MKMLFGLFFKTSESQLDDILIRTQYNYKKSDKNYTQ